MWRAALTAALFLAAGPARAQVIELHGGDSSIFSAAGGGATLYFPNSTADISLGVAAGHLVAGFSDQREWRGWHITIGDHPFGFPIGTTGLGITTRGLTFERRGDRQTLSVFVGTSAWGYYTPFFSSAESKNFGVGLFYRRDLAKGWDFSSLDVIDGKKGTALQEFGYHGNWLRVTGVGGLREGSRFWGAQVDLQRLRFASVSAAHQTYFLNGRGITVDDAGAALLAGPIDFHAAIFASNHVTGESAGAGARAGPFDFRADYFQSRFGHNFTGQVTERIGQRFRLAQYVSNSAGHWGVNYAGGWTRNLISVDVGYQTFFVPLSIGHTPFQQALTVQVSLQLPSGVSIHGETSLTPDGRMRFSTYGSAFVQGPLAGSEQQQRQSLGGKYMIRGIVTDGKSGMPVEGAAIRIGGEIVYTDSSGSFFLRQRRAKTFPVAVSLNDFVTPRAWRVVVAPETATAALESTAQPISIVLE
jgi:hypothetical protein